LDNALSVPQPSQALQALKKPSRNAPSKTTIKKDCQPARLCYAGDPFSGADPVPGEVNGLENRLCVEASWP